MEDADVKLFLTEALSSCGSATRAEALAPQMQEAHQAQEGACRQLRCLHGKTNYTNACDGLGPGATRISHSLSHH